MRERLWQQVRPLMIGGLLVAACVCAIAAFIAHQGSGVAATAESEQTRNARLRGLFEAAGSGLAAMAQGPASGDSGAAATKLNSALSGLESMGVDVRGTRRAATNLAGSLKSLDASESRRAGIRSAVLGEVDGILAATGKLAEVSYGARAFPSPVEPLRAVAVVSRSNDHARAAQALALQLLLPRAGTDPDKAESESIQHCKQAQTMLAETRAEFAGLPKALSAIDAAKTGFARLEGFVSGRDGLAAVTKAMVEAEKARADALAEASTSLSNLFNEELSRERGPLGSMQESGSTVMLLAFVAIVIAVLGACGLYLAAAVRARWLLRYLRDRESLRETLASRLEHIGRRIPAVAARARGLADQLRAESVDSEPAPGECEVRAPDSAPAIARAEALVASAQNSLSNLVEAGTGIQELTTSMRSISFKTNLLALNAAIEAAHAGPAGAGFGVVAAEVKELASQAADSAEQVDSRTVVLEIETRKLSDSIGGISEAVSRIREGKRAAQPALRIDRRAEFGRASDFAQMSHQLLNLAVEVEGLAMPENEAAPPRDAKIVPGPQPPVRTIQRPGPKPVPKTIAEEKPKVRRAAAGA